MQRANQPAQPAAEAGGWSAAWLCPLVAVYIAWSAGLVCYNKYLMNAHRFPFPAVVVLIQMFTCSGLSGLLYFTAPGRFPAVQRLHPSLFVNSCLPIAVCFMMELMLGTAAMMSASVPFLQMVKESGVAWVYFLSLLFAVETLSWRKLAILLLTLAGTWMTVRGETHFALIGFLLQGAAVLCAALKTVLQQLVLQSRGTKLDPLSYVLVMSPISAVFLVSMLSTSHYFGGGALAQKGDLLALPSRQLLVHWAPDLLANAVAAFLFNIMFALVVKNTTAIAITLLGLVKDTILVCGGSFLLGSEELSVLQGFGFALQLGGVLLWSAHSTSKEQTPPLESAAASPRSDGLPDAHPWKIRSKKLESYGAAFGCQAGPPLAENA